MINNICIHHILYFPYFWEYILQSIYARILCIFLCLFQITCRLCQQIFFVIACGYIMENVSFAWSILWSLGKYFRACCYSQYLHDDYDNKVIIQYFSSFLLCPFLNNKVPRGVLPSIVIFCSPKLKRYISKFVYSKKDTFWPWLIPL